MNCFRLNFSHGTHDEHSATFAEIRKISEELGRQLAVLQDLCGPKIRVRTEIKRPDSRRNTASIWAAIGPWDV